MKYGKRFGWGMALLLTMTSLVVAEDSSFIEKARFSPVESLHATWVFSGIVSSETGDDYGYFFQLQRDENQFKASVALMDETSKHVLFHEESEAELADATPYNWRVGHAFLKFNPINDSWIFGVKTKEKQGFNFKVDMLKQFESKPVFHHLKSGMTMMISQTSELNGHIITGEEHHERFVSSKKAWFRQIWQDENVPHALTSVLCRFNDGSSFYSVNLAALDAQSGAIAAWYNPEGLRKPMSQFIQVSQSKEGAWHIRSQAPRLDMVLSETTQQHALVAGFVDDSKNPGFCVLNQGGAAVG